VPLVSKENPDVSIVQSMFTENSNLIIVHVLMDIMITVPKFVKNVLLNVELVPATQKTVLIVYSQEKCQLVDVDLTNTMDSTKKN
jgi:hypothetical protein